jgi:hypothetical protein
MQNTPYSLAEYKIIENAHGDLWWETHIGLGSLKSGECFINGNILFMIPDAGKAPGFLKGEFLDHLKKLPKWEKTKYYCTSYKIYKCKSGRIRPVSGVLDIRSQEQTISQKIGAAQKQISKTTRKSPKANMAESISYILHQNEIIEKNDGQLYWKSHSGLTNLKKGKCHIKGNILFLEPGEILPPSLRKKEFLQQLAHLPNWEKTEYFCPSYTVYDCKTGAICRKLEEDKVLIRNETKNLIIENKISGNGLEIKPIILNKIITKDKLRIVFDFCSLLAVLIMRLLFECAQMIYKAIRVFIGRWTQFRD